MSDFDFDEAISSVQRQIDSEIFAHEKRIEFWKGYQAAMREFQQHMEKNAT